MMGAMIWLVGLMLCSEEAEAGTRWATATGELNGSPMVYRYVEKLPDGFSVESQPERVDIYWAFSDGNNGMPGSESKRLQTRFEDKLESLERSLATLALVRTGAGMKSWVYYTSDTKRFMSRLNELLAAEPRFPLEIEFVTDAEWKLYWSFWKGVDRSKLEGAR